MWFSCASDVAASARQLITVFAVVAFAGGTGSAFADIDPASDVLPLQDVFLPYNPEVCTQLSTALRKLTARSRKAGYPLKVAVIASKRDLGGASTLFGDPRPMRASSRRSSSPMHPKWAPRTTTRPCSWRCRPASG